MAGATFVEPLKPAPVTAIIRAGQSLSDEINLRGMQLIAIQMPPAWTAASLTFQAAEQEKGTFGNLYDDAGNEITLVAAVNQMLALSWANQKLIGSLSHLKIRSGTGNVPVVQAAGADRTFKLIVVSRI